jgi:hypothetical protein
MANKNYGKRKFELKFDTDNAAFDADNGNYEIARILRDIANNVEEGISHNVQYSVRDINGNKIGYWTI